LSLSLGLTMRSLGAFLAACVLACCVPALGLADATPAPNALRINAQGPFSDLGVWIYRGADGKFSYGKGVLGTNERLVMPLPQPSPGGAVSAVTIIRHKFDTLGYPMHVALVEKLFAQAFQGSIFSSRDVTMWEYDYHDPMTKEKTSDAGAVPPKFAASGPFSATGDIPPEMQAAFAFAVGAMKSIVNLPDDQKDLKNYGVLFVDDGQTIWVELGPRFGPAETAHLGCQTLLGRDMVFGYDKKQSAGSQTGKFLQCF
jgi:hypothetical protein